MKPTVKAAFITGVFGVATTIAGSIFGAYVGGSTEQRNIQNEINEVIGNNVNIVGDDNDVTINDLKELVENYQKLQKENDSLTQQNTTFFDELEDAKDKIKTYENESDAKVKELEQQINEMPDIQFKNISLSIDGDDIPINSTDSSVIINNRTYYSDEFIRNTIDPNTNISVKDNTMYIGKIIKEKASLFNQYEFASSYASIENNLIDSYGKPHPNSLLFSDHYGSSYITYSLEREFSLLKFKLFVRDKSNDDSVGTITIKADDEIVYTSTELVKTTEEITEESIPINNCSLLTIRYNSTNSGGHCIMSDAEIYN